MTVKATNYSGFVFKKQSLDRAGISIDNLSTILELEILDQNDGMVS